MPPDGYDVVTLPEELIDRLDGAVDPDLSRSATIRALLEQDGGDPIDYGEIERRCKSATEDALAEVRR